MSSWFKHCSESLIDPHRKSYLVIICPKSHEKLTKSEIRSSYYFLQFDFIYPYLAAKYHFCQYLALPIFTTIYLYLAVFLLNYLYLGIFALNCPDFTICAIFTLFMYPSIETAPLCKILEQSDHYLWRYCILKIWGIRVSFGCEHSCSSPLRVSNFNSNVPQGGVYPHIKFERDSLNTFRVRVFTSLRSTGGHGDAKTIISPNTSFSDIITTHEIHQNDTYIIVFYKFINSTTAPAVFVYYITFI